MAIFKNWSALYDSDVSAAIMGAEAALDSPRVAPGIELTSHVDVIHSLHGL